MGPLKEIEILIQNGSLEEATLKTNQLKLPKSTKLAVLASIAFKETNYQKAEALFERSLKEDPNNMLAIGNYGQLLVSQKQFKRALPFCKKVSIDQPKHEGYLLNLVSCLADSDKFNECIDVIEEFIKINEKPSINVLLALSSVYRAYLRPEKSLKILEKLRNEYSDNPEIERAIADAYAEIDPLIARKEFEKAVNNSKKPIPLKWNWSFVELRLENFNKGWQLYENGLDEKVGKVGRPLPAVMRQFKLITKLEDLDKNKYTLLACEQGIGDQILFLSSLDEIIKNIDKPILIAEERMIKILQRSFPKVEVKTYGFANSLSAQLDRINGVFPIGSLMKYCRNNSQEFIKNQKKYININEEKKDKYKKIIKEKVGNKKLIGVSWSGGHWDRQKRAKSIEFTELIEIIEGRNEIFISLQYGDISEYKKIVNEKKLPIVFIDGIDFRTQIDDWIALAGICDEIISVSTALVHFAGAAEMKVKLLLGKTQSPFIWGLKEGTSLPYKTVEIFRQMNDEKREDYINRLKESIFNGKFI